MWWRRFLALPKKIFRRPASTRDIQVDDRALVMSLSRSRIPSLKQIAFLPRLLSAQERRLVRLSLLIAALSLSVLIGRVLFRHVISLPTSGGTLTEAIVGTPQYLNPILARPHSADTEITRLLFRGLFRLNENMLLVPDLAKSYSISPDGKTYTITLLQNLRWSDGTPLTSADAVYTFETITDANYQSPIQGLYKNISVTAPDAQTIVFTLREAYQPFLTTLTLGLLPASLWQDQTPQTFSLAELNVKPVGNGPFKFQSVSKNRNGTIRGFTFVRNTHFSGPAPLLDKVSIKMYPETTSAVEAITSNAVDSLGEIESVDFNKIQKSRLIKRLGISQVTTAYFNQKSNSALKSKEVRQALAASVNRSDIIATAFHGLGRPAFGPLLPGQPGYDNTIVPPAFNPDQANTILEAAGWKKNESGVRIKNKQELALSITTVDEPSYISAANILMTSWKALGANVTVTVIPSNLIQKDIIKPRKYDVLLFGQISNTDANPYPFWHSSQQIDTGFSLAIGFIKKIDQDLESAQKATSQEAQTSALQDFQKVFQDEVPAVILTQSEYLYAHQKSLRGLDADRIATAADRFNEITHWYLKTRLGWK